MVLKQGQRRAIERTVSEALIREKPSVFDIRSRVLAATNILTRLDATEAADTALDTRMDTAEADIVGLDARVDTAETNIITQAAVDVDHETRIAVIETALPDKLEWATVPASAGATGAVGQVAYEAGWLYVCVATDTWERTALATWV